MGLCYFQGRQAIEWVIDKIDAEVKEIASSAVKSTDELFTHTKKSFDDITTTARKSMDDISSAAKKSFDDLQNLGNVPSRTHQHFPKI
jgi:predicted regulator of Ras-like GTPase activity (Roadblock/LC7/MglB family)